MILKAAAITIAEAGRRRHRAQRLFVSLASSLAVRERLSGDRRIRAEIVKFISRADWLQAIGSGSDTVG